MVSVCMITYNQEDYIKQAIESVLSQQTDYTFELNIFNDASTDKTNSVICEIVKTHPKGDLINYHLHEKNIGLNANYIFSLQHCKGKYVAICEGDDYWIGKSKLQRQVEFLEQHEDYYLCFHKALRMNFESNIYSVYPTLEQRDYSDNNFFQLTTIPMASVVFRNTDKIKFSPDSIQLDFNLLCSLLSLGKARMINDIMSVYRVHAKSATFRPTAQRLKQRIFLLSKESKYTLFNDVIRKEIGRLYGAHASQLITLFPGDVSFSEKLNYFFGFLFIKKTNGNYQKYYMTILKSIFKT